MIYDNAVLADKLFAVLQKNFADLYKETPSKYELLMNVLHGMDEGDVAADVCAALDTVGMTKRDREVYKWADCYASLCTHLSELLHRYSDELSEWVARA